MDWVTKKFLIFTPSSANLSILGVFKNGYLFENPTASCGWSSTRTKRKLGFFSLFCAFKPKPKRTDITRRICFIVLKKVKISFMIKYLQIIKH